MAKITKFRVALPLVIGYLAFVMLAIGVSFVSRISFAPYLVFHHIAVLFPAEPRFSALLAILALGLIGGLVVGVSIGIPLGFVAMSRPVTKALWVGVSSVALSLLWWIHIVGIAGVATATQSWSMLFESTSILFILCVVTGVTDRVARKKTLNERIFLGTGSFLIVFLVIVVWVAGAHEGVAH